MNSLALGVQIICRYLWRASRIQSCPLMFLLYINDIVKQKNFIISPFFFEELQIQNEQAVFIMIAAIVKELCNSTVAKRSRRNWKHDYYAPHIYWPVRELLLTAVLHFANLCPSGSPDFNPAHYWLWGEKMSKISKRKARKVIKNVADILPSSVEP